MPGLLALRNPAVNYSFVYNGRRSYAGALCTIRYYGPLPNADGDWLGVEWDDPSRGKHDGRHGSRRIFWCLSSSPTAASFLRPTRKPDDDRTLLEAVKFKYAPVASVGISEAEKVIEISGKVVEEVGFERIQKQLSVLTDLKIVLVDELVVSGIAPQYASEADVQDAIRELGQTCPNIVELDIGWNVVESWQDVADMCTPFQKLKILKAGGLRLRDFEAKISTTHPLHFIEELHMNENLLTPDQILEVLFTGRECNFPALRTLSLSLNELESLDPIDAKGQECPSVTTIILANNKFRNLSFLTTFFSLFPGLKSLSLQGNAISTIGLDASTAFPTLETLNLAANQVQEYSFIGALPALFPNLTSLRISRNPLYEHGKSEGNQDANDSSAGARREQASSMASDSTPYYLTLARLPGLKSLNYTNISPRDREEGEIYYLSVAEKEIAAILDLMVSSSSGEPPSIAENAERKIAIARQSHPLYTHLCVKYDREDVLLQYLQQRQRQRQKSTPSTIATKTHLPSQANASLKTYPPGTLGARLVDAHFYIPHPLSTTTTPPLTRPLPPTISVYRLKSLVAAHFSLPPLRFKLIYESHEYDPVEPIQSTRNLVEKNGAGGLEEAWRGWGDWDVDDVDGFDDVQPEAEAAAAAEAELDENRNRDAKVEAAEVQGEGEHGKYITREGHRFKKRETEILDGMRPWGDFWDVDVPGQRRRRNVVVRVEPHPKSSWVGSVENR